MNTLRRAASVFAQEGTPGVAKRIASRMMRTSKRPPQLDALAAAKIGVDKTIYERQVAEFTSRCHKLGLEKVKNYYWYHTVDLGNGLLTPGDYDYRNQISHFGFPGDMTGQRVLDVGSATGYFAFEFERRGADVTSVELPSMDDWDILACDREHVAQGLIGFQQAENSQEASYRHLDGPFLFCQEMLKSQVRRVYSSVYDLSPARLGQFDFIYVGDMLLHLFSPLAALDVLSQLCKKSLMLTIDAPPDGNESGEPSMQFLGMVNLETDHRSWWSLNTACATHMLQRMGFKTVTVAGEYRGIMSRAWAPFYRRVILATRD